MVLDLGLPALVDTASLRLAVAGDVETLQVPGRPNWIYAHLGSQDGPKAEVHVSAIAPNIGDSIYIQRIDPPSAGGWRMVFRLRAVPQIGPQ